MTLHYVTCHYTTPLTLHYVTWHYTTSHDVTLRHMTLHYVTWHYTTPHDITLRHMTLHYVTWRYTTPHDITLRHMRLHYVTWRYTTSHEAYSQFRSLSKSTPDTSKQGGSIKSKYINLLHFHRRYTFIIKLQIDSLETFEMHMQSLPHFITQRSAILRNFKIFHTL